MRIVHLRGFCAVGPPGLGQRDACGALGYIAAGERLDYRAERSGWTASATSGGMTLASNKVPLMPAIPTLLAPHARAKSRSSESVAIGAMSVIPGTRGFERLRASPTEYTEVVHRLVPDEFLLGLRLVLGIWLTA